eukprot:g28511.t1
MSESGESPGTESSALPWRDKDPPPGFDGDVEKFEGYLRELKMWRHETDVPAKKHAVKMLRALSGPAKAVCQELEVETLLTEAGAEAIVNKLKEYYQPHLETAMPRAFERAVYGEARRPKETFGEFIVRQDALFHELREEGVPLDETVRGYVMFRQANLSQTQEDQVTTWTQGKFDRPAVLAALRKLEKVQRERGGKHYLTVDEDTLEGYDSEDDGNYIYLGDADLEQVYEEEELTEALATYQQVRQAIREQKNGRGYFQPKGIGKSSTGRFGKGAKGSQMQGIKFGGKGTRVHIDVLKLRTKCARCGQIGHWARECVNEPDAKGKNRASSASDGASPKSGFCETGLTEDPSPSSTYQPFSCMDGATQLQITKASIYAELIQLGEYLGKRKCKEAPTSHIKACGHPMAALAGAGNQAQREAWCRKCHARWGVDARVMDDIANKKKVIHVNGKTFTMGAKSTMTRTETPPRTPVRTPSAKKASKWPMTPGSPLTPPWNAEQLSTPRTTTMECHCKAPAVQLIVKKEGPTQGRLFWKCAKRVCNFFEWDPQETQALQRKLLQEQEDAEVRRWEEQEEAERKQMVQQTMLMAEHRHQEIMEAASAQHALEVETLKNQLLWMSAVAGEERMEEVFKSPVLQQEMMSKAMAMKEELQSQEAQAQMAMEQVILLKNEAQWNLWCKKQLEESSSEKYERQVADGFWVPEEDGTWRFHSGILPRFHTGVTAVGKFCDSYFQNQDYEPEEERPLSKATCKAVNKRMKQLVVSEFFSPPRVSKYAEEKGHLAGGSFDLETGYDLSMEVDRRRCWKELRQADPDVIVVSPPCGPFSILQSLNQRHQGTRSELRLAEGREHLQFAMEVFRWQTLRGKLAIFEHPATSRAWQEECVQEIMMIPGVQRVRADQCQYGLAVKGGAPNRKPTDFLTNGVHTAIALSRRCRGEHAHQPLIGGIAHLAQRYPRGLCAAMINGSKKDLLQRQIYAWATSQEETEVKQAEDDIEELLRQHEEKEDERQQAEKERGVQVKRQLEAEDSHERREGEDPDHVQGAITAEDKRIINKLHQNLGHPNNYELSKALRLARARNAVWRYVKDEFKCDICERNKKPKAARPAMLPKTFEPCRTIGLDVVYFPALDVRQVRPVLNMLDWATGYQMLEPLDNTQSSHIWEKFHSTWIRTFSVPEIVVTDQGREFGKELAEKVSQAGALHRVIGARAPWQQGRTERRGGVAKEVFVKLRESMLPTSEAEWKMCVHAVEAAKNRMYNRSGFSPAQRQFGYNMRLPGSLGSDDVYSPELLIHSSTDDMQRAMEIRNHAMQEYLKHVTSRAVAKAQWARGRVTQEFKIGDVIYVYRVPLQRKRARSEVDDLFGAGDEYFFQQMEQLRQRFDFGKFVMVDQEEAGVGFNGRRIKHQGGDFLIDMEKFVTERLSPVRLSQGRATKAKEDATEEEKELVRAAVGSLTWAAKEGRPDAAAAASLIASSVSELKVQDVLDLNRAINQVRENAQLAIRIQAIPMTELCWGVVTDASYANVSKGKSQGAYAVLAMEKKILHTGVGKCNMLHWRSGKIHRVVNSTLAAETQALSRGLAELSWTVTVRNEFTTEAFDMRRWEEALRKHRMSALVSESSERALAENLSIVDAKSLFDHLSKETVGTTNDKRTALEMQVVRQMLAETRTAIKWVPHPQMVVDCLTKRHGNIQPLLQLLHEGVLRLREETDTKKNVLGAVNDRSIGVSFPCSGHATF